MLDSVSTIRNSYGGFLVLSEWFFTFLFTIEYFFRLSCVGRPFKYATSFFGIVDLLAIIPTYLSLFLPGSQFLIVIRILRLLRIFRVFKLVQYLVEIRVLNQALRASRRKIIVFLFTVFTLVIIFGSMIYVIASNSLKKIVYCLINNHNMLCLTLYSSINKANDMGRLLKKDEEIVIL